MKSILSATLVLALCAPAATQPAATNLITQAEQETARLREVDERALSLADVALAWQRLGDPRWETTWAQALQVAEGATDPVPAALLWRGLAVRLWPIAPETARGLLDRAMQGAKAIAYPTQQALVLREIGRAVAPLDPAVADQALAQAAEAARRITAPLFKAAALRDIASVVACRDVAGADRLFAEALGALPPADPDETTQLARIEVAVAWSAFNLDAALAEAELLPDDRLREVCYRRICEALAPTDPDTALSVIARIHDEVERPLAMAALAASLARTQPETAAGMARSALAAADKMTPEDKGRLQADAAIALAPLDMPQALGLLAQGQDERLVSDSLRRIIAQMAQTRPAEALQALQTTEDWQAREGALVDIMPILARHDPQAAAAAAAEILSRRERVKALLTIAEIQTQKEKPNP